MFPAINIGLSGTRKEELLMDADTLKKVWLLRKMFSAMSEEETLRLILSKFKETKDNESFMRLIDAEKSHA